jgi:hypothetical protein
VRLPTTASIEPVGIGQLTNGTAVVANLPGIDDGHGQLGTGQCGSEGDGLPPTFTRPSLSLGLGREIQGVPNKATQEISRESNLCVRGTAVEGEVQSLRGNVLRSRPSHGARRPSLPICVRQ